MFSRDQRGAVYAEFILSFLPFFLLFLAGVQLALIAQARIVVQHAASQAVRAAVVRIDDDPIFYEDGKRKVLSAKSKSGSGGKKQGSALQIVESLTSEGTGSQKPQPARQGSSQESGGSGRLAAIRNAAYLPLSAIGPLPTQGLGNPLDAITGREQHDLADATGGSPLLRVLNSLAIYGRVATAITFPKAKHGAALRDFEQPWGDDETVHVRVTYLFHCSVPLVRRFACRSLAGMQTQSWLTQLGGLLGGARAESDPSKQRLKELEHAEWAAMQKVLALQLDEQFIALRGEAALPNQGAAYRYPSELCKTKERAAEVDCAGKRP